MTKQRKKEFKENRTSWKWFANRIDSRHYMSMRTHTEGATTLLLLNEILKELQYQNDKTL